jgi:DNA-binding CsgD family transcriptional regulator
MPAPPVPALVFAPASSPRKRKSTGADAAREPREGEPLSPREREISLQAVQGMSNAEIAAALELSIATVKFHLSNIFEKLGIVRRSQLAWALQQRQAQEGRRRSGGRSPESEGLRAFLQAA